MLDNTGTDPSYTITVKLENPPDFLIVSPVQSVLVVRGYNPGQYMYRVSSRANHMSRSVIIEGTPLQSIAKGI
jgi:hypothetical protein